MARIHRCDRNLLADGEQTRSLVMRVERRLSAGHALLAVTIEDHRWAGAAST
jgi:hypothetical protein